MKTNNYFLLAISYVLIITSGVIFGTMMLSQSNLDFRWGFGIVAGLVGAFLFKLGHNKN
jgi:type IV secretory pathway VirB2 component (pilin)